jgi:molybdenum cofactor synthesis domain-containing protein
MPSCALVVIGNEILSGKFADENGPVVIARARALGADLVRVSYIPDEVAVIAEEVRRLSAAVDVVVTSGGVGPTHDDVTLEAVAAAFGLPLELHPELMALFERFGLPDNEGTRRMAWVPEGSTLLVAGERSVPVVRVRNVFVLPGVPRLFRLKFEALEEYFRGDAVHTARLYTTEAEWNIAAQLTAVAQAHPNVAIGSYPRFDDGLFHVIVTLESRDAAALESAHSALSAFLSASPPGR